MAELNEIGVIDGVPSSGTGEVPTLAVVRDALLAGTVETGTAGTPSADVVSMQGVSGMTPVDVVPKPATTGGLSTFTSIDLDETHEEIKGSAGQVYSITGSNTNASARYLKLYNAATAGVTVGSTVPVFTLYLPATTSFSFSFGGQGLAFSTGICAAATTGVATADTGAPSANDVIVNIGYK